MLVRRSLNVLIPAVSKSQAARRYAHAAAIPNDDDEPIAESSSAAARRARAPRADPAGARDRSYSFPTTGRMGGPPDPYEVLGLDRAASDKEVKQQYYRLALILHPDSPHPASSAEHFAMLHRAYALLSDSAKRSSYLQTGLGWSATGAAASPGESHDMAMRSEINRRRQAGAAEWGYGRGGFREGGAGGARAWHPYDADDAFFRAHNPQGKREERYMSNSSFFGVILSITTLLAYAQWLRLGSAADTARGVLEERHVVASHALAEARREAALYGKERREQIRRRVRENEVLREIDGLVKGSGSGSSHKPVSDA